MSVPYPDTQPPAQDPYGALAEEIALRTARRYGLPADQNEFELAMMHAALDAVTEALHRARAAGLLLPEGAETRTEWRVTGDPGGGFPLYDFTWSAARNPHLGDPERGAREFVALVASNGGWPAGPHLSCRTVAETRWDAVRLAVGDSKPTDQDHGEVSGV